MLLLADALILIWDGKSPGSRHMKAKATKANIPIHETIYKP